MIVYKFNENIYSVIRDANKNNKQDESKLVKKEKKDETEERQRWIFSFFIIVGTLKIENC